MNSFHLGFSCPAGFALTEAIASFAPMMAFLISFVFRSSKYSIKKINYSIEFVLKNYFNTIRRKGSSSFEEQAGRPTGPQTWGGFSRPPTELGRDQKGL